MALGRRLTWGRWVVPSVENMSQQFSIAVTRGTVLAEILRLRGLTGKLLYCVGCVRLFRAAMNPHTGRCSRRNGRRRARNSQSQTVRRVLSIGHSPVVLVWERAPYNAVQCVRVALVALRAAATGDVMVARDACDGG
jgi:hypothetical protein